MNAFNCAVRGRTQQALWLWSECNRYGDLCSDINSNAYKHMAGTMLGVILRDDDILDYNATRLSELSAEYNLLFFGQFSDMACALARLTKGDLDGIEAFFAADAVCVAHRAICNIPMLRIEVARRAHAAGRRDVAEALIKSTGEMMAETAEETFLSDLHRLRATLALEDNDQAAAEQELQTAIDVARRQSAGTFELRASIDSAKLWRDTGKADDARQLLTLAAKGIGEGDCEMEMNEISRLLSEA